MIRFKNMTKSYMTNAGRHYVFRNLTMEFPAGKNIAILGQNGAGKSTMLRLISKTDRPDRGIVEVDEKVSWPVGLSGGFQGSLSGRDNARFVCRVYGCSASETAEKIAFVEEFAEVGKYFDLPVKTYSSGMRARVAFGLSMAFDFDYYLIDEITAVGDERFRRKSEELFNEKRATSHIVMATHNVKQVQQFCDLGVLVHRGEVTLFDDIGEAIRAYRKI